MDVMLRTRPNIHSGSTSGPAIASILLTIFVVSLFLALELDASALDDVLVAQTYHVDYASAGQLEPILRPLLSPGGSLAVDERTNSVVVRDTEPRVRIIEETIARLDSEMPSRTFHLNYADADAVAEKVSRIIGPAGGIVEPDPRTHTLYVATIPSRLERVESLISTWDKPTPQVLIQADILDVSSAKLKELGIEWELRLGYNSGKHDAVINIGTGRDSTDVPSTGSVSFGTPSQIIPPVFDASGNLIVPGQIIPGSDFSATIEALIEDRSTRTLSRPRILVLDGHPARFEVSTLEPYANTQYSEYGTATSLDIQFLDIGIILETTPHINNDGYVMLEVEPEVSTLERDEFFDTTIIPNEGGAITTTVRVPVKSQNRATTMVMIRDGQTIAIGGLRTHVDNESISKVPILGDIPILGIPFRNLNQSGGKRELIIFITPHIVSPSVSSPEVTRLEEMQEAEDKR